MPRVAIIGAGPAGLVSAKSALECYMECTIFEQASQLGGLWRTEEGSTWNSMRTNLSHFNCMFSDFPWPADLKEFQDFPTQAQMWTYLTAYAKEFTVLPHIKFAAKVINIVKNLHGWQITSQTSQELSVESFDFVIIATGIFTQAYIPQISGIEHFAGVVQHTKDYKAPEKYRDKQVVIVGGAYSGAEIAAEISFQAKSVTNIIRQPFWVLPRYIPQDFNHPEIRFPLDLIFYKRSVRCKLNAIVLSEEEKIQALKASNKRKNDYFSRIQKGDQSHICQELQMDPNSADPARVIISDNYLQQVSQKKITIQKGQIKHVLASGIVLNEQTMLAADVIMFATGYQLDLPFFDAAIKKSLNFDQQDQLQPMLLHKETFHPELANMAFVGMYRGPYFAVMELQARWIAMVFSGKVPPPSSDVMEEGIAKEKEIREQYPRPQFPHGDYVAFADSLAQEIGMPKNLEDLTNTAEACYKILLEGPVVSAHFRFFGHGANKQLARELSEMAAARVLSPTPLNDSPAVFSK